MADIGMVDLILPGMRVRMVDLADTPDEHLDGEVGVVARWNLRQRLWDVRLPNDDIVLVHPTNLREIVGLLGEQPAARPAPKANAAAARPAPKANAAAARPAPQANAAAARPAPKANAAGARPAPTANAGARFPPGYDAAADPGPPAPPAADPGPPGPPPGFLLLPEDNAPAREPSPRHAAPRQRREPHMLCERGRRPHIVLNCDSIGMEYAKRLRTNRQFSWEGIRQAYDYYTAIGVDMTGFVSQGYMHDLPPNDRVRTMLVEIDDDDQHAVRYRTITEAFHLNCQAIDNYPNRNWPGQVDQWHRYEPGLNREDFMIRVNNHVTICCFDPDGNFLPANPWID